MMCGLREHGDGHVSNVRRCERESGESMWVMCGGVRWRSARVNGFGSVRVDSMGNVRESFGSVRVNSMGNVRESFGSVRVNSMGSVRVNLDCISFMTKYILD